MNNGKLALILSLCILPAFCWARDQDNYFRAQPYSLEDQGNYFSLGENKTGNVSFEDEVEFHKPNHSKFSLHHLKHTKLQDKEYLIWNVLPVGIGYSLAERDHAEAAVEWKLNYISEDPYLFSPAFTGKRRSFWNSQLGSEFVLTYSYHYFDDPSPSIWDLALRYSLLLRPFEKWNIGAFIQPRTLLPGVLAKSKTPEAFFSSGMWTELSIGRNLIMQLEGTVNYLEKYVDQYLSTYSVSSSLGLRF